MTPEDLAWQKLVTAARRVRDERDEAAPYGFSTRVVAMAMAMAAREASIGSIFERFSWRALGLAGLLAITSVAANYAWVSGTATEEDLLSDETTVAALFDTSGT